VPEAGPNNDRKWNVKFGSNSFSRKEADPKSGLGSLTVVDIATVEAAQVKLAVKVIKKKYKKAIINKPLR
jgi:hypothetical protein